MSALRWEKSEAKLLKRNFHKKHYLKFEQWNSNTTKDLLYNISNNNIIQYLKFISLEYLYFNNKIDIA